MLMESMWPRLEDQVSTYQYYEFQAIDRRLTQDERNAVAPLSSRVDLHPWRAVFVYHWSDFPGDSKQVLTQYYDAKLYLTNSDTRWLLSASPEPSSLVRLPAPDPRLPKLRPDPAC